MRRGERSRHSFKSHPKSSDAFGPPHEYNERLDGLQPVEHLDRPVAIEGHVLVNEHIAESRVYAQLAKQIFGELVEFG